MAQRFRLHQFETLPSTQIEARTGVEQGNYRAGDVIIAAMQSAGYGRRGRAWQSPIGNLSMTFVEDFSSPQHINWLGYAIGLGLYDTVKHCLSDTAQLALKWPNDLLINQHKLAGLLLEICGDQMLIGIGMNVATRPDTDQPVTALHDHSVAHVTPVEIAKRFFDHYQTWRDIAIEQGFAPLRHVWLQRAAFLNQTITARLANQQTLTGRFENIDEQGALVLTTESGHHIVTTADIYLNTD